MTDDGLALCEVENCEALLGGPRDTPRMCAECAAAIEEQDREHAMGDEQ